MSSRAPPIPPAQRARPNDTPHIQKAGPSRRDDAAHKEQGRHGMISQSAHSQRYQQDR